MPVFNFRALADIQNYTEQLATMFVSKTPLVLTPEEFITAFINPEHRAKLVEVQELVGFVGQPSMYTVLESGTGCRYDAQIHFTNSAPLVIPQYVVKGLQPTCPDDVRAKIDEWVAERVRFGEAFGDAKDALELLNATCGDAAAMKVMLPCLTTLMATMADEDSKDVKRAKRVADAKRFGALPRLTQSVKQRLIDISALVNAAALTKEAPLPTVPKSYGAVSLTRVHQADVARRSPLYDYPRAATFL